MAAHGVCYFRVLYPRPGLGPLRVRVGQDASSDLASEIVQHAQWCLTYGAAKPSCAVAGKDFFFSSLGLPVASQSPPVAAFYLRIQPKQVMMRDATLPCTRVVVPSTLEDVAQGL